MKFTSILLAAAGLTVVCAAPAIAAPTIDAFTTFTGTQGAGGFSYGDVSTGGALSLYGANTNCFIDGSTCLQRATNHDVPGATKSTGTSFQYNSVNVPDDRLLVHPESGSALASTVFTATTAGQYRITGTFNVQDVNATGVDLFLLSNSANTAVYTRSGIGSLSLGNPSLSYTTIVTLAAGKSIGFGIGNGNGGLYYNDSTGENFSVTAVPEPATWSLMIVGFGAVGFAMRRRNRMVATYA